MITVPAEPKTTNAADAAKAAEIANGAGRAAAATARAEFDVHACPLEGLSLIEASAGTGKTWNICGLYLRLLLERRLTVQQILVVTFTNAASAELRERIRTRIAEVLEHLRGRASSDAFVMRLLETISARGIEHAEAAQRLELALHGFDEASICTIHGFCQRALGDTPLTAQLPLALELLPDDAELVLEAVHDQWRRLVAGDAISAGLAAWLDQKRDTPEKLARLLRRELAKPLALRLWPEDDEDEPPEAPSKDDTALAAAWSAARATWMQARDTIVALLQDGRGALYANSYKSESLQRGALDWDAIFAADELAPLPHDAKAQLYRRTVLQKKTLKDRTPPEHAFFEQAEAWCAQRDAAGERNARERLRLLRTLLGEATRSLRAGKRELGLIAFDDMLWNVHERLVEQPALAPALRARFPAALIDEFQDTDPLQFAIFKAIYGAGDAFLVGDPKQAIYGFRHADLHSYLQARGEASAAWSLAENQRSTPGLITALNTLFGHNTRAFMLPGLDYHAVGCGARPRRAFVDRSAEPRADLQLWLLPQQDGAPPPKREAQSRVADASAAEIARLLDAAGRGEILFDERPLGAGDIAVLVRSHAQGGQMRTALAALGIGSVELSQASIYGSRDAEDVERVLAAILEPTREPLLRAALATQLVGCDAAEIDALAEDEGLLLERIERFDRYREAWQRRGPGVMFRQLLAGEDVSRRMLARADGERRLTNLLHLAECLHQAAAQHAAPEALLQWLRSQRRSESRDDATQLRLESDRNLVQIVTIHKAKGLEYPVVFCPFLWNGALPPASGDEGIEYHDEEGRAVIDFRGAATPDIKARIKLEESAEALRLAYVALTRAACRCYLVAGCYTVRGSAAESGRSLLNWLVADDGQTPAQWFAGKPEPAAIEAAWVALAKQAHPHIGVAPLPMQRGLPLAAAGDADAILPALAPPATIPAGWRIGSYSALTHGAAHERAARDHDARAVALAVPDVGSPAAIDPDDVLLFPRGAAAGDCIHAVFERIDFSDRSGWPAAIGAALQQHPQTLAGLEPEEAAPRLAAMLARLLDDVMQTVLPHGLRLETITPAQRLTELEFQLPARGVAAAELTAALRRLGYGLPALAFGRLDGYLKGYIDLVFQHHGRYYLLDWKSNHLGNGIADYGRAQVGAAMAEHGYHLQQLLYSVALDRYLRQRVPGYEPARHFGGAYYLFVRGVRPGWRDADGAGCGVHFDRPSPETLQALGDLLDATAPHLASS
jgi:exodeoxyribonuclease V beta subunit